MCDDVGDYVPMIIPGGKRVTFAGEEKTEVSETISDMRASRGFAEDTVKTPFSLGSVKAPETVVAKTNASPDLVDQKNTKKHPTVAVIKPEAKTPSGNEI